MAVKLRSSWARLLGIANQSIAILLAVQFLAGTVLWPQRFFFPIYLEEEFGYAAVVISSWVAVAQLLGMVAAVIGGALSDAIGRKWTLMLGLCGLALGSLMYLASAPILVFIFWAIGGLALGFHAVGAEGYLIDAAQPAHLGVFSALYNWGYTLGGAIGSAGAGIILDRLGFTAFGLALLAVAVLAILIAVALLPRLRRPARKETSSLRRTLLGYRELVRQPTVVVLGLMRFLPTCYWGMATVLIPLLINRASDSLTTVALYATLSQVLASLAQLVVGRASDRWGPRRPTISAYAVLILSIVGLAAFSDQLWGFFVFGIAGACAAWSLSTLMPSLVSLAASVEQRGRVLGALHLLWNLGMMVGAMIGGALMGIAVGLPFLIAALLNLGAVALAVSFFHMVKTRKQTAV